MSPRTSTAASQPPPTAADDVLAVIRAISNHQREIARRERAARYPRIQDPLGVLADIEIAQLEEELYAMPDSNHQRISFAVTDDEHAYLEEMAANDDRRLTEFIRRRIGLPAIPGNTRTDAGATPDAPPAD